MSEQCNDQTTPPQPPPPTPTPPPPPKNCEWAEWSVWSQCSATCGGGKHGRTRGIKQEPECGGDACAGLDNHQTQDCNTEPCDTCELKYEYIISMHFLRERGRSKGMHILLSIAKAEQARKSIVNFTKPHFERRTQLSR